MDKEELRERRKEAYRAAKARRDADPEYQALKEKQKEMRRAQYKALMAKKKQAKQEEKLRKQADKDEVLKGFL